MISQAQEQTKSIVNNHISIDNAIDVAMEKLQAAKRDVSAFRSAQESLENENASLTAAVKSLREEKTNMEIEIEIMKIELSDLNNQLKETRNDGVLTKTFTTTTRCDEEPKMNETNKIDDDDSLQHDDWKEDDYFDDSMSIASTVTTSTASSATSSKSSSSRTTKRRARKSYNSPKKWRRMIRTHRLQSIFINGYRGN